LGRLVKLALVSDIHANLEALQATLADLALRAVDRVVCLGDLVGYNTRPAECIALIRRIDALCVAGNHDMAVCGRIQTRSFSNTAARAVAWTHRRLTPDDLNFLGGLPVKADVEGQLIAVHGGLHPETERATVRLDNDERRMQSFKALIADPSGTRICAFGHTHHAAVYEFRNGRVLARPEQEIRLHDDAYYLINPGTIGQPRSRDRRASYMVLDLARRTVHLHRVDYDASVPLAATRAAGLAPAFPFVPASLRGLIAEGLRALRLYEPLTRLVMVREGGRSSKL
jgi:predicted phosphodiesterase